MKKFKLFTTIASLCLAVALMAFGVYAASQVTASVSGTIQFGATTAKVELVDVKYTVANGKVDGLEVSNKEVAMTGTDDKTGTLGNVVVTDIAQDCTITVVATFKNVSNAINAVIAAEVTVPDSQPGYTLTFSELNDVKLDAKTTADATATYTITFTLKVTDNTQSVSGINYSAKFTAKQATND